jgi:hypothetical protein
MQPEKYSSWIMASYGIIKKVDAVSPLKNMGNQRKKVIKSFFLKYIELKYMAFELLSFFL